MSMTDRENIKLGSLYDVAMKAQCDNVVTTMIAMGATFHIHKGALGAETWSYLEDEAARPACRKLLGAVDRDRIGFNSAFIAAICVAKEQ